MSKERRRRRRTSSKRLGSSEEEWLVKREGKKSKMERVRGSSTRVIIFLVTLF